MRIPRPPGARKKSIGEKSARLRSSPAAPATSGYYKSFDGTRLFYSVEGQGRPLIFCYGLVCSSLHWTYQIQHFNQRYQTVWFDYRGHQNSDTPKDLKTLTLSNMAADLGILLDELNIKDAVFLGHSMGVNVVLELYRQQPKRVAAMVLANGTAKRPLETLFGLNIIESAFQLLNRINQASPKIMKAFWRLQGTNPLTRALVTLGGFNPHLTAAEDIRTYVDQVAQLDPAIFLALIESYRKYDATSWLHNIAVPTLIIAGENDKITPILEQELLHQLIPGSQMSIIRHGSHCPQMDLPELVNLRIAEFLDSLPGA